MADETRAPYTAAAADAPQRPPDIPAMLMQAVTAHRQGRIAAATAGYGEILRLAPGNFDALHLLGVIALQERRTEEGVGLIRRAVDVNPHNAAAHLNLAGGLTDLQRLDEALVSLERALALKADYAEAWCNRGHVLADLGRGAEAVASCDRAIALKPDLALAHGNRGNALLALGRAEEALASCDRAIALKPDHAESHNNRGSALLGLQRAHEALASFERACELKPDFAVAWHNRGRTQRALARSVEALASFDRAIALKPDFTEAHHSRGNTFHSLERWAEAAASFERVVALAPAHAEAHNHLGTALRELGRVPEALACFERAVELDPDYAQALNNRGNALVTLGRVEEGVAMYDRSIALQPGLAEAHNNRGHALQELGRLPEALASFEKAIELKPDYASAHWNESLYRLLTGDFERGWKLYEWRWPAEHRGAAGKASHEQLWLGEEALQGKTVLLHCEQGLGDTIHFCRYARLVAARGATVLLKVQPPLESLLRTLDGVSRVASGTAALPTFDFYCPLLSLPLAFATRMDTIPADSPYLFADPGKVVRWQARLDDTGAPRVGLAWAGSTTHQNDHNRSVPLRQFAAAIPPGVRCYSLQKELRQSDHEVLRGHHDIEHLGDQLEDFADTAAVISQMDLVICVDTAVAHLAGALGKTVWVLLPFAPDWRWLLDREDSPWYPGMRLFRQTARGDWDGVLARVRNELIVLASAWRTSDSRAEMADRVVALNPDHAAAWHNRGRTLLSVAKNVEALASFDRAIALAPDFIEAHQTRGNTLYSLKRWADAAASFERVIALAPARAEGHNQLGATLRELGRVPEALACFERAVELDPDHAQALNNRGNALMTLGRAEEGLAMYDRSIALQPGLAEVHNNRGHALLELGRLSEALASFETAIALKPDRAEGHSNCGNVLMTLGRAEEALVMFDRSAALKPDLTAIHNNRGVALEALGRYSDALASFAQAIVLSPDDASARLNESLSRLRSGNFEKGWQLYEWRWQANLPGMTREAFREPLWLGEEAVQGRTILLHWEQGLGDTIQFCRYARLVAARGATVLLKVQPPLEPLLRTLEGVSRVASETTTLPAFDFHCPLLSLPLACATRMDTIPADIPYLFADPQKVVRCQARLDDTGALRAGVVWAGSAKHQNDRNRSLPLTRLLGAIPPEVKCYSLQKELRDTDREVLERRPDIAHLGDELADFADTAAMISQMDVVICVDTSVAHIAGALGKPVWLLLPFNADWRWFCDREDSPWYSSARLFRQTARGDWDGVLARVRSELIALAAA